MSVTGLPLSLPLMPLDGLRTPEPESIYNAAMAAINDKFSDWSDAFASWTPIWTNFTVGNGTVTANYIQTGKLVICRLKVILGSTSAVSGDIRFTLPVASVNYGGTITLAALGLARAYDQSAGPVYEGKVVNYSTTVASVRFGNTAGTYLVQVETSNTVPFTWANLDELSATFWYEAA